MIKLIDNMQDGSNKEVEFKSLNEVFLNCLETIVDTVDKGYNNWIQYYLDNPNKLDDISILKKVKEVEATDYKLVARDGIDYATKGICQICGDTGVKTHVYNDINYNTLSACTACLGVEDRNSPYRYSQKLVEDKYLELKEITKEINSIESFIKFAKANIGKQGFQSIEIDDEDINRLEKCDLEEYLNGEFHAELLRFEWKLFYVYMNPETFELENKICVWDSEGEDVCSWIPYDKFHYEYHKPTYL